MYHQYSRMPGKEFKLIKKTLHADGYYTATISTSETSEAATATTSTSEAATTPKKPHIKIWFRLDKGLIIGPEEREKLIREEQQLAAPAAKADIPTPGFVLVKEVEAKTTAAISHDHHHSSSSSDDYFQSKLDVTKRKMHDSYQQLANVKKQRMIQVIDPRDLPPPKSTSKGKGGVIAARKKMFITNRKTRSNNNFFDGGSRQPKLVKPSTSVY